MKSGARKRKLSKSISPSSSSAITSSPTKDNETNYASSSPNYKTTTQRNKTFPRNFNSYLPPPKISSFPRKLTKGNLSPLRTRRKFGNPDQTITTPPDFAIFDYRQCCPQLMSFIADSFNSQIGLTELDKIQSEVEQLLLHTIDHQKKICGELNYQSTGEYTCDDISNRPMPSYQMKTVVATSTGPRLIRNESNENRDEDMLSEKESMKIEKESLEEDLDVWPTLNLPQKFWTFVKDFGDVIDRHSIQQWLQDVHTSSLVNCSKFPQISGENLKKNCENGSKCWTRNRLTKRKTSWNSRWKRSTCAATASSSSDGVKSGAATNENFGGRNCDVVDDDDAKEINSLKRANGRISIEFESPTISNGGFAPRTDPKRVKSEHLSDYSNSRDEGRASSSDFDSSNHELYKSIKDEFGRTVGDYLENVAMISKKENPSIDPDTADEKSCSMDICIKEELYDFDEDCRDEVSHALEKVQRAMINKEMAWRPFMVKIWHRLLAECLRNEMESELDKADKELFNLYEKYYCDFPRRRPSTEAQRKECISAMQKRNNIARMYYNMKYIDVSSYVSKLR